jgi:hypothetical protein
VETGLIKLYFLSGNEDYLNLSRYFLDQRGDSTTHELYGPYSQDHLPVTMQDEVVGHAVRAVYMYAGMTDIAAIQNDKEYLNAVNNLWENMVFKKMYVTGGIGALHAGEAFGKNYELPNLTAYNETCAAIGSVYWNQRLFMLTGDVKYYDVIERTLYNGLISGLSLDGEKFFYPNALESDGKYTFNQGACTRKSWFDCSCCPTNLIRFIPSIPGLIYSKQADTLFVNLYASNKAQLIMGSTTMSIEQQTDYPWKSQINISIDPEKSTPFTVKLRIPGWLRDEVLPGDLYAYTDNFSGKPTVLVNSEQTNSELHDGYMVITKDWAPGDKITMELPMSVRTAKANDKVEEDMNKRSFEYGPLVYCVEEIDNSQGLDNLTLSDDMDWAVEEKEDLLDGVSVIKASNKSDGSTFSAIPYYAWSNRGIGTMKVWLPYQASK